MQRENAGNVRSSVLYTLQLFGKLFIKNMTLALYGETERLDEGGDEADGYAPSDGYLGVGIGRA